MKIGLGLPGDTQDPQIKEFMDDSHGWVGAFEGDLTDPFEHPKGIARGAPFEVSHQLGEVPGSISIEDPGFTGAGVYATAEDRDKWTSTSIVVRSNDEANANITVRVRKRFNA